MVGIDDAVPVAVPFVLGAPRSGTTLLRAMLTTHPELCIPFESHFVIPAISDRRLAGPDCADRYLAALGRESRFQAWNLPLDAVAAEIERSEAREIVDCVRATFRAAAQAEGKPRWGDKTPAYAPHALKIAEAFPEARIIHVVRDPRASVSSYLETEIGPNNAADGATRWSMNTRGARHARDHVTAGRYLEVRYEEMVADTERVLGEVCRFIDLPYDPAMLEYWKDGERISTGARTIAANARISAPVDTQRVGWKERLTPEHVSIIEGSLGSELETFGYERTQPRTMRSRVWRGKHVARRVGRWANRRRHPITWPALSDAAG